METCGTLGSKVCHDDRVFGSAVARLMGIESSELSQLGFWDLDAKSQAYTKIYLPDTAAKLSGFGQAKDFFIERASFDPEDATDPEVKAFVRAIFSQIDDPEVIDKVRKKASGNSLNSDRAASNVSNAFRLLRKVLLQNIGYYYAHHRNLSIFNSKIIKENFSGFKKWMQLHSIVCNATAEVCPKEVEIPSESGEDALQFMKISLKNLWEISKNTCSVVSQFQNETMQQFSSLKDIFSGRETTPVLLEGWPISANQADAEGSAIDGNPCEDNFDEEKCDDDKFLFKKLPKLSTYSLQSIYDEWTKEIVLNDVRHPASKVLDERRKNGEPSWNSKNHGLKTSIQKRRKIAEYVQKLALKKHGSVGEKAAKEAIKSIVLNKVYSKE